MTRTERRQFERQQAKQAKKSIVIDVATTLELAKNRADSVGQTIFSYKGIMYVKVENGWEEHDVVSDLLKMPAYLQLYNETIKDPNNYRIVNDLLLTVMQTNMGSGSKYDLLNN